MTDLGDEEERKRVMDEFFKSCDENLPKEEKRKAQEISKAVMERFERAREEERFFKAESGPACPVCGRALKESASVMWFQKDHCEKFCKGCSEYIDHVLWELDGRYRCGYDALPHVLRMLRGAKAEGKGAKKVK
ncbi:MAG: hypothetical protein Q7T16_02330 [Candidatus Burarchaeum sp.]|nr:hypothetical protein [Candidatus Burarchaeum sp.]MDO8339471.1 hypothetical protein [Candidatus Burarchaeum sp.]